MGLEAESPLILSNFTDTLTVLEGNDESLGELVGDTTAQTIDLIIVGRSTYGILDNTTFLIAFNPLQTLETGIACLEARRADQYLYLEHRLRHLRLFNFNRLRLLNRWLRGRFGNWLLRCHRNHHELLFHNRLLGFGLRFLGCLVNRLLLRCHDRNDDRHLFYGLWFGLFHLRLLGGFYSHLILRNQTGNIRLPALRLGLIRDGNLIASMLLVISQETSSSYSSLRRGWR